MPYIGNTPTTQSFISGTDYFSGTGSQTAYTLTRTVNSVNDIEVVINNVVQQPSTAYTLSGTTITFTSAPSSGTNNIYVRYLSTTLQTIAPSDATVTDAKIVSMSASKLTGSLPSSQLTNAGLVRITSGTLSSASAITVDSCFTSTYKNYTICVNSTFTGSNNSIIYLQFRASGSTNSSSSYTYQTNYINANLNSGTASTASSATAFVVYHNIDTSSAFTGQINIMNPVESIKTQNNWTLYGEDDGNYKQMLGFGTQTQATSFDGFTLTLSSGTLTGTYDVYGVAR